MLILTRKVGETVQVGDPLGTEVTLISVDRGEARLGFTTADDETPVWRKEIAEEKRANELARLLRELDATYDKLLDDLLANTPQEWEASDGPAEEILVAYVRALEKRLVDLGGSLYPDGYDSAGEATE